MLEYLRSHPIVMMMIVVVGLIVGVGFIVRKNNGSNPAGTQNAAATTATQTPNTPFVGAPGPQFVNVTTGAPNVTIAGPGGPNPPPPPTIVSVAWNWTYHPTDNESIDNLGSRVTANIQAVFQQYHQAYTGNAISKTDIIAHNPWLATGNYIQNTPRDNLHVGARTIVLPHALPVNTAQRGGGVVGHPIGKAGATSGHGGRKPFGSRSSVSGPGSIRGSSLHPVHHGGGVVGPGGVVGGEKTGIVAGSQKTAAGAMHMGLNHAGDLHHFETPPPQMDTPTPPMLGGSGWTSTHMVGHGDTIHNLAVQYNQPWYKLYHNNRHTIDSISHANGHDSEHWNHLYEGTVINVP